VSSLLDGILNLHPAWILAVTGLLVFAEDAIFIGFLIPGETAAVLAGVSSGLHGVALSLAIGVVVLAAIVGDSVGYEIGRRFGPALQASRLGRKVGPERWARAEAYLHAKGGAAIFGGRFVGVLRALVPAIAGATRMPYRRFLLWNASGALVWAPGTVLAGYLAGSSYHRVAQYAGPAGLMLLAVAGAVAAVVFAARRRTSDARPGRERGMGNHR
jgi:membrane protein DedA with SNARE-associated domain